MLKSETMYKKSTMYYCVTKFKNYNHRDSQYNLELELELERFIFHRKSIFTL